MELAECIRLVTRFLQQIEGVVSQYALSQSYNNTSKKLCELGQDGVTLGAATLVLNHFFETVGESEKMIVGGEAVVKTSGMKLSGH